MAKLPGLYEREGVYQLRVMVPTDLRPHYGGRSRLVESLGATARPPQTAPGRPAVPSGSLSSMSDASKTPRNGSSVSPELGKARAADRGRIIGTDESARGSADKARLLLAALRPLRALALTIGTLPPVAEGGATSTPAESSSRRTEPAVGFSTH